MTEDECGDDNREKNSNDENKQCNAKICDLEVIELSHPNAKERVINACRTHGAFYVKLEHQNDVNKMLPRSGSDVSSLFTNKNHRNSKCIYRGRISESGSATQASEPKESWEYSFDHVIPTTDDDDDVFQILSKWASILRQVTIDLTKVLEWKNLDESHDDNDCQDLLRAFYYYPKESNNDTDWGSSPHTDWGTWTVVWQDDSTITKHCDADEGGLYIHNPQSYNNHDDDCLKQLVLPKSECVLVHVGDMISLASDRCWKSPIHSVQRFQNQYRTSLVYFAYPPKSISFHDFQQQYCSFPKVQQQQQQQQQQQLPYSHYMLLHNQKQIQTQVDQETLCQQTFENIKSKTIQQIIQDKWSQVQR